MIREEREGNKYSRWYWTKQASTLHRIIIAIKAKWSNTSIETKHTRASYSTKDLPGKINHVLPSWYIVSPRNKGARSIVQSLFLSNSWMLSKSSKCDLDWSPPSSGGNSISSLVMPADIAASIARLASLRKSACMSIFLERDFSNGDIPFGMGVSDSDDDDDDWVGGRELIQGDAKAFTIWCLESRRTMIRNNDMAPSRWWWRSLHGGCGQEVVVNILREVVGRPLGRRDDR